MARRTKYNEEIVKKIEEDLRKGTGRVATCKNANIHYTTFLDWYDNKPEFSKRIKRAEKQGAQTTKETLEGVIFKAAKNKDKPQWQAAAWYLERKFPGEYALHQQIHNTNEEATPKITKIKIVRSNLKDDSDNEAEGSE